MVCVHNYSQCQLSDRQTRKKTLESLPITEQVFYLCTWCSSKYVMYHQYAAITAFNRKAEAKDRKEDKLHRAKLQWGEESTAPKLHQQSLHHYVYIYMQSCCGHICMGI